MLPVLIFGIRVYWYLLYLCTIWVKKRYFPEKYFPGPNSIWQLWLLLIMLFYCVLFWQRTQLLILEGGWRSGIFEKTMKPPSFSHVIFFWILLSTAFIFQQISKVCTTFESWDTILPGPSGFGTPAALKNLFI